MKRLTCVFLVLLRLTIGWHFLIEGIEKVEAPAWSSEPYLREATGPLAPTFRWMAGDTLVDRLQPQPLAEGQDAAQTPPHTRLPKALDREWNDYAARFADYYHLDEAQRNLLDAKLTQRKDATALWLVSGVKKIKRDSQWGPSVEKEMTTRERVQEYQDKVREANELQDQSISLFGAEVSDKLRPAKAAAAKMRAELRRDLDEQTADMKKALRDVLTADQVKTSLNDILTPEQQERSEVKKALQLKDLKELNEAISKEITSEQLAYDPVPKPSPWPWPDVKKFTWPQMSWSRLEWINWTTKYGLCLVGACLILGLFTPVACIGGALFLLLFYLAMPPLPGLPENPKAEGHYLYINKNIIEMLALLVLSTTYSGRWLGLDGLLQFLVPSRWRSAAAADGKGAPAKVSEKSIVIGLNRKHKGTVLVRESLVQELLDQQPNWSKEKAAASLGAQLGLLYLHGSMSAKELTTAAAEMVKRAKVTYHSSATKLVPNAPENWRVPVYQVVFS